MSILPLLAFFVLFLCWLDKQFHLKGNRETKKKRKSERDYNLIPNIYFNKVGKEKIIPGI